MCGEQPAKKAKFPCKFAAAGCSKSYAQQGARLKDHEKDCCFSPKEFFQGAVGDDDDDLPASPEVPFLKVFCLNAYVHVFAVA